MTDLHAELEGWLSLLGLLFAVLATPVLAGFFLGRALRTRFTVAIFGVGAALLTFLAYRRYQSVVAYCNDSPEVESGGDRLSCLEPQHWFAIHLELLVLVSAGLGLATILVVGVVRWRKQRSAQGIASRPV